MLAKIAVGFLLIHSAQALQFTDFQAAYEFSNPGTLGADSSGKNNALVTNTGNPTQSTSGRFGGALLLNGTSSMKLTTFPPAFPSGNSSYTIAAWVKPDSDCPTNANILSWGVANSLTLNSIALDGDKNGVNNNWWNGDFRAGMRSGSFFDGNFHLIISTWDSSNSTRTISIDGIIVNKRTVTNTPNVTASNFVIGAGFKGLIDNVMIANTALPETDIPAFWNSTLAANSSMYTQLSSALNMAGGDQNYASLSGNQAITNTGGVSTLSIGFDQSSWQLLNARPEFPINQTPTSTFTGALNSASIHLVKLGRGTQILQTNQNFLTTSTLVRGGRLELDASKLQSNVSVTGSTTFGSVPPEFGGKGTVVGNVILNAGSNMVLYTSGILDITGSLQLNNNKVRLNLPMNLGTNTYPLCKFLIAGSSGSVAPIPEILSGSFASTTTFKVEIVSINATQKQIQLVVSNRDTNSTVAGVKVYPPVPGLTPSNKYSVRVRRGDSASIWNSVFVFQTKAEPDRFPHGYFNSLKNYSHSYVNFEMNNSLPVVIEIKKVDGSTFTQLPVVRPSSKAIAQLLNSNTTLEVRLSNPCSISVDIDGQMENAHTGGGTALPIHTLSIHANPIIADKPDINAAGVLQVEPGAAPTPTQLADTNIKTVYFKPGMHHLGVDVQLYSDKNYYIPGDAIVYATFNNLSPARPANKIRIYGHGTISGERFYHWNDTPGGQDASQIQRPIDMNSCSNVKLEGITVADSANNSILVASSTNHPFPANEVTWLKVFTWRVNGDGGGCSDNSEVNNCFMRTQDDGLYVNGRNVSDTVLWNDVNGIPMRMSALPNLTDRVFTVKNIDVVYSRKDSWSGSVPLGLPGDPSTVTRGQNVVFSNINVSDPYPSGSLIAFDQNGGTLSGIRFENVTMASATNAYLQKSTLNAQNGGQIQNLNFYNLKFGSTTVTAANYLNYFTVTQSGGGSVQPPTFTDSLGSLPKVSVTSTLAPASEPSSNMKFTFTRTGSTTLALAVGYSVIGKAINDTDYEALNGFVTIPAGLANANVTLTVKGDTLDEGTENVTVVLTSSPNYVIAAPSNATVDIIDGDLGGGELSKALWTGTASASVGDIHKAFDSSASSEWISFASQAPGQFFQLDMDSIKSFNRIEITSPGGDHAIELDVVVSNNGVAWSSPIASVFGGGATTKVHFPIQNARFIKLIQKGTATALKWWRIADLDVFGPFDGRAWIPTASHNTGALKSALDGNLATRWTTNTFQATSPEQWFQVDMKTARNFDTIYLNTTESNGGSYNDFPVGYQVMVSDTGSDWTTQTSVATGAGTPQITKIILATPVTKQYIRIKQTGSSSTNYWSLVEFFVFPTVNYGISSLWKIQDIGSVGQPGSFSVSGSKWTLAATGKDIWTSPDSFRYVYQSVSGDTNVSSNVSKIVSPDAWARSGVMIRESTDPGANYAMLCWTPGNGLQFQWRSGGTGSGNVRIKEIAQHQYLRITRAGGTYTPATSLDGSAWTDCVRDSDNTSVTQSITMATSSVRGLIVSSHENGPPDSGPTPVLRGCRFEPQTPAP